MNTDPTPVPAYVVTLAGPDDTYTLPVMTHDGPDHAVWLARAALRDPDTGAVDPSTPLTVVGVVPDPEGPYQPPA